MMGVEEEEEEEEDEGYRWKEEKPPDGRSSGGGWHGGDGGSGGVDNSSGSSLSVSRESSGSESHLPLTRGKGRPRKRTLEGAYMLYDTFVLKRVHLWIPWRVNVKIL